MYVEMIRVCATKTGFTMIKGQQTVHNIVYRISDHFPSQSTSSMHLLHPLQQSLHIRQPVELMLQQPCIVLRQQDQDFTQQ